MNQTWTYWISSDLSIGHVFFWIEESVKITVRATSHRPQEQFLLEKDPIPRVCFVERGPGLRGFRSADPKTTPCSTEVCVSVHNKSLLSALLIFKHWLIKNVVSSVTGPIMFFWLLLLCVPLSHWNKGLHSPPPMIYESCASFVVCQNRGMFVFKPRGSILDRLPYIKRFRNITFDRQRGQTPSYRPLWYGCPPERESHLSLRHVA